jgi:hypothetical protein
MRRDNDDPEGQYQRENYMLNDVFCAQEGDVEGIAQVAQNISQQTFDKYRRQLIGEQTITDLVHEVINQREKVGMATYHRPLLAGDGRDTLQDAIEEAADLLQYLVKLKVERDSG